MAVKYKPSLNGIQVSNMYFLYLILQIELFFFFFERNLWKSDTLYAEELTFSRLYPAMKPPGARVRSKIHNSFHWAAS